MLSMLTPVPNSRQFESTRSGGGACLIDANDSIAGSLKNEVTNPHILKWQPFHFSVSAVPLTPGLSLPPGLYEELLAGTTVMEKPTRSTHVHGVIASHRSQRHSAGLPNLARARGGPSTVGPVVSAHKSGGRPATGRVYASTFEFPHPPSCTGPPAMRLADYAPPSHPLCALEVFDEGMFDQDVPPSQTVRAAHNDVRISEPRGPFSVLLPSVLLPSCENIHSPETGLNGPIHSDAKRHDGSRGLLVNPTVGDDQPKGWARLRPRAPRPIDMTIIKEALGIKRAAEPAHAVNEDALGYTRDCVVKLSVTGESSYHVQELQGESVTRSPMAVPNTPLLHYVPLPPLTPPTQTHPPSGKAVFPVHVEWQSNTASPILLRGEV